MGYGDALIAAGLAEKAYAAAPGRGPVAICRCDGQQRWRPEWHGNPAILPWTQHLPASAPRIRVGDGCLPYHPWNPRITWQARDHRASLYFTKSERKRGAAVRAKYGPFILIDPPGTDRMNSNRRWPGWAALAQHLRTVVDLPLVQLDRPEAARLPGVHLVPHNDFRDACAILQQATLAVLTEGGITVGAATVGTPAVVLWGGCVAFNTFGYPEHVNLVDDDPRTPCGSSRACAHCAAAWAKLTPEHVADVVRTTLRTLPERRI